MIEINKVYKADNGDLFVIKKNDYKAHSKEEIEDLLNRAKKMYKDGNYEECICKIGDIFSYKSYIDKDGIFIGNEEIHITDVFSSYTDGMYFYE